MPLKTRWLYYLRPSSGGVLLLPRITMRTVFPAPQTNLYKAYLPVWMTALVAGLPTVWLWRRDRRPPEGYCRMCGYDLTGNVSGRCSECGMPVGPGPKQRSRWSWLRRSAWVRRAGVAEMVLAVFGPWIMFRMGLSLSDSRGAGITFLFWALVGLAASAIWWAGDDGRSVARRTVLGTIDRYWPLAACILIAGLYAYLAYFVWFVVPTWG